MKENTKIHLRSRDQMIATLPIPMVSFSLGNTYKIGEEILASNVAVGTLLMLPTVMIFNLELGHGRDWPFYKLKYCIPHCLARQQFHRLI